MKKRIGKLVSTFWRHILVYAGIILLVGGVLFWKLGTLVPGLSYQEQMARASANSFHKLLNNPIYLPHKAIQYIFIRFGHSGAFWMRAASALWAIAILLVFYDIIRTWYSRRVALMSTFLLLTASWFLHFARLGTPEILLASSIGLLWVGMKLKSVAAPRIRTILTSIMIFIICLYVPGLAWIVVPLLFWQRKTVWREFSKIPRWIAAFTGLAVIVGLAPLAYGLARHPSLLRPWLFIPTKIAPQTFLSNAWHIPIWFTLKGPTLPVYWLGHLPMLDVFTLVMGILGIFVLSYFRLLDRVRAIAVIILLAVVLAILNGWVALTIALPLIFVIISAGIALFLQQWFTVFPRNPLARAVGITVVTFVVLLSGYYNVRSYFVAWPRNSDTKQVFNLL